MKQVSQIISTADFSSSVSSKHFAVADSQPFNAKDRPARECIGYDCIVEKQLCLAGTEGSQGVQWICVSKKWVVDDGNYFRQSTTDTDMR